jgi:hypothetical protein
MSLPAGVDQNRKPSGQRTMWEELLRSKSGHQSGLCALGGKCNVGCWICWIGKKKIAAFHYMCGCGGESCVLKGLGRVSMSACLWFPLSLRRYKYPLPSSSFPPSHLSPYSILSPKTQKREIPRLRPSAGEPKSPSTIRKPFRARNNALAERCALGAARAEQ